MKGFERPSKRVLVIFGATGDLAKRKLFPGFFHLFREGLMPEDFRIIGSGRHSPGSDDSFRQQVNEALQQHGRGELDEHWDDFAARLSFVVSSAEDGADLAQAVTDAEAEIGAEGERLVYLSVPPGAMQDMVRMLGVSGIAENCSLVVEKPFGHDEASAKELNATLHEVLDEESIYRIDHFLGKEAAQGILALRFANGMFEPVWNRDHVAYIQIDVPEELDIQGRSGFYEQTGAFRDMVVTHLLQILGIVALEPPSRIDAEGLHLERTKLFDAIRPLDRERVVFGQYDGYRDDRRGRRRLRGGDVRRDGGVGRHLALERGAVLPAHRQVAGRGAADGHDRLRQRAAAAVSRAHARAVRSAPASSCSSSPTTPRSASRSRPRSPGRCSTWAAPR